MDYRFTNFNVKRAGYDRETRRHDHDLMMDVLSEHQAPHVLFLSECTAYEDDFEAGLWEATSRLNELWGGSDTYLPFLSDVDGSRNRPGLFVSAKHVRIVRHYKPSNKDTRRIYDNLVEVRIDGKTFFLKVIHWDGTGGPAWFDIQSARTGQLASLPAIIGGDFNGTSSHPDEVIPGAWEINNRQTPWKIRQKGDHGRGIITDHVDKVILDGFWDVSHQARDFTPTVNDFVDSPSGMNIDRMMVSCRAPMSLVPGSYLVDVPEKPTKLDHRMQTCLLRPID